MHGPMKIKKKKDHFLIHYKKLCIYGWKVFLVGESPLEYYSDKVKPGG